MDINDLKCEMVKNLFSCPYGFEGFYHYTCFDNLLSMFKYNGIYSRNKLKEYNIPFVDKNKLSDETKNCLEITPQLYKNSARFYIKKDAPAVHKFAPNLKDCCIVLNYTILFDNNFKQYISIGSPMQKHRIFDLSLIEDVRKLCLFDFNKVYNNTYYDDYFDRHNRQWFNKSEYLCDDFVPIKYIKSIKFFNAEQYEKFKILFPNYNDYGIKLIMV